MSDLPNDVKVAVLVLVIVAVLIAACLEPLVTFLLCLAAATAWAITRLVIYLMEESDE